MWELSSAKLLAVLLHAGPEVVCVALVGAHLLFSADSEGNNYLWYLDGITRYDLLCSWRHNPGAFLPRDACESSDSSFGAGADPGDGGSDRHRGGDGEADPGAAAGLATRTLQLSYSTQAKYHPEAHMLYTGDFAGQLTAWQLGAVLAGVDAGGEAHADAEGRDGGQGRRALSARVDDGTPIPTAALSGADLVSVAWCMGAHGDQVTTVQVWVEASPAPPCKPLLLFVRVHSCACVCSLLLHFLLAGCGGCARVAAVQGGGGLPAYLQLRQQRASVDG